MTLQEAFDIMVTRTYAQGRQSYEPGVGCVYRGSDGLKCAVGHLLTDEQIAKYSIRPCQLAGFLPESLASELVSGPSGLTRGLLAAMQAAHDDSRDPHYFRPDFIRKSRAVAARFGLTMPEVTEC